MKNIKLTTLLSAMALGLAACGGGSDSSSNSGTLNVLLTDNPACGFDHVYVTINEVRVHHSASAKDTDAGWTSIKLATPKKS